eukprot:s14_g13.t2
MVSWWDALDSASRRHAQQASSQSCGALLAAEGKGHEAWTIGRKPCVISGSRGSMALSPTCCWPMLRSTRYDGTATAGSTELRSSAGQGRPGCGVTRHGAARAPSRWV